MTSFMTIMRIFLYPTNKCIQSHDQYMICRRALIFFFSYIKNMKKIQIFVEHEVINFSSKSHHSITIRFLCFYRITNYVQIAVIFHSSNDYTTFLIGYRVNIPTNYYHGQIRKKRQYLKSTWEQLKSKKKKYNIAIEVFFRYRCVGSAHMSFNHCGIQGPRERGRHAATASTLAHASIVYKSAVYVCVLYAYIATISCR